MSQFYRNHWKLPVFFRVRIRLFNRLMSSQQHDKPSLIKVFVLK